MLSPDKLDWTGRTYIHVVVSQHMLSVISVSPTIEHTACALVDYIIIIQPTPTFGQDLSAIPTDVKPVSMYHHEVGAHHDG